MNNKQFEEIERPGDTALRRAVAYIESIGLTVYGPCMDLDTGDRIGANMDFDADAVVKYRTLKEKHPDIPFVEEDE